MGANVERPRIDTLRAATKSKYFLAAPVAMAALGCIVVPRICPIAVASLTLLLSILVVSRAASRRHLLQRSSAIVLQPEMLFVGWSLIACLWSMKPFDALMNAALLAGLILHLFVLGRKIPTIGSDDIEFISLGLVAGFIFGGLYISFEIVSHDALLRFILTHIPQLDRGVSLQGMSAATVNGGHIPRVAVVYCLLWCPALLSVTLFMRGLTRWICYGAIATSTLVVTLHPNAQSQTAQFAMVAAVGCLAVAVSFFGLAKWVAGAVFAAMLLLIVPVSLAMFAGGLHKDEELFTSARARIVIWNYTSERVLEKPIFGVGTYSTRAINDARPPEELNNTAGLIVAPATRAHPHNVYLQIWYELGAIGALAFAILGISLLQRISSLSQVPRAFALSHFAIGVIVIGSSYGMWQVWFQCIIALSVLALLTAAQSATAFTPRPTQARGAVAPAQFLSAPSTA